MPDPVRVLLVDASPYIFRAYFALPSSLTAPDGSQVNAVHGFASFLIKLLSEEAPSHVGVAFDGSLTTSFRNEIFPDYKANRELPPAELVQQLERCRIVAEALGLATAISDRFEADDLIGGWLEKAVPSSARTSVVTSDKDLAQLVEPGVDLYDFAKGERWDPEWVRQRFGVAPEQIVDYLALAGDSVDNIPGVAGVGPKTAAALLAHHADLETLLAELDGLEELPVRGARSLRDKLREQAETARMSRELARIERDVPVESELAGLRWAGPTPAWERVCEELGFGGMVERGLALKAG